MPAGSRASTQRGREGARGRLCPGPRLRAGRQRANLTGAMVCAPRRVSRGRRNQSRRPRAPRGGASPGSGAASPSPSRRRLLLQPLSGGRGMLSVSNGTRPPPSPSLRAHLGPEVPFLQEHQSEIHAKDLLTWTHTVHNSPVSKSGPIPRCWGLGFCTGSFRDSSHPSVLGQKQPHPTKPRVQVSRAASSATDGAQKPP